jgi:hypothetical protein
MNQGFLAFTDNVWEMAASTAMRMKVVVMLTIAEVLPMQPASLLEEKMGAPSVERGAPIMPIIAYVKSAL